MSYKLLFITAVGFVVLASSVEAQQRIPPSGQAGGRLHPNVFILEMDARDTTGSLVPEAFFQAFPQLRNRYDFLGLHNKNLLQGGYTSFAPFRQSAEGTLAGVVHPSGGQVADDLWGNILGFYTESFGIHSFIRNPITRRAIDFLNNFYFSLLMHELTHYWGISNIQGTNLENALVLGSYGHWQILSGSWIAADPNTRRKYIESNGRYYFIVDCGPQPKHPDIDLYSMGVKSASEVREKLVIPSEAYIPGNNKCDSRVEVPASAVRRTVTAQDVINVLGPRIPPAENAQKDFSIAFVLVVPRGEQVVQEEIDAMNWIADKFPVVWYQSTEGRSTLNRIRPQDEIPPAISNIRVSGTGSSLSATAETNEPATSFLIYGDKDPNDFFESVIFPNRIITPPAFETRHSINIQNAPDTPILPDHEYKIKLIAIDRDYNFASIDIGVMRNGSFTDITSDLVSVTGTSALSPVITSITPNASPGSQVTIGGRNFPNPSTVEIKFPYGARIFLPNMQTNGTSISFQVPTTGIIEGNEMADGEYIISVGSGQGTSNYLSLTYSSGGAGPAPALDLAPTRTTVVTTANVRVRTATSLSPSAVRGLVPAGTVGQVILGPRFVENYRWWYVDFGGNIGEGWVVANFIRAVSAPDIDPPSIVRVPVPSTVIPQTNAILYRVRYTAPVSRDIPLRSAPLTISSQNVSLPYGLSVYAYSDAAFSVRAFETQPIGQIAPVPANGEVQIPLLVNESRSPIVPAGQTRYFEVRGDVLTTGANARLSIRVTGLEEEVFQAAAAPSPTGTAPASFVTTIANTLIIRATANGTEIGRVTRGVGGVVVDGPVTAGQYRWWRIRFNGAYPEGWVAGDFLQFVGGPAPVPAAPTPVTPTVRPVVTRIPVPSTTLPQSNAVLYRVAYTAPASADWTHDSGSLIVTRGGVYLNNFAIFAYRDPGFSIRAYDVNPLTTLENLYNVNIRTRINYNFSPVTIPAGETRYFELRGDVTGGDASAYLAVEVEGLQAEEFRRTPLAAGVPRIISLTPREINLNRNNVLTVRGENFPRLSTVEIITPLGQSISLNNVVTDGSVFSLQVPPDGMVGGVRLVSGPVDGYGIRVGSSQGTSSPAAFTYSSLAITSQSHYSVSPGTSVTLSGFDFPTLATVQITFPDNTSVFLPNVTTNGNSFSLRVPENGILGGRVLINGVYNVAIGSGRGTSSQVALTYAAAGTPVRPPLQRPGVETPSPTGTALANRLTVLVNVLNVRAAANGAYVRQVTRGSSGTVIDGPITTGGYTWWRVRFDNASDGEGWIAGGEYVQFVGGGAQAARQSIEESVSAPLITSLTPTVIPGSSIIIGGGSFPNPSTVEISFPDGRQTSLANIPTNGSSITLTVPTNGYLNGLSLSNGSYGIRVGSGPGSRMSNSFSLSYSASGGTGVAPPAPVSGSQLAPPPATVNPVIYSISPPSGTLTAGQAIEILVYGINFNSSAVLEYRSSSTTPGVWTQLHAVLTSAGAMSLHPSQTQGFGVGTFSVRVRNLNTGLFSEPVTYAILGALVTPAPSSALASPPPPPGAVVAILTVNGYDNALTVGAGSDVTVNWVSANASNCSISPYGWSGTSGSQVIRSVAVGTYTALLTCGGVNLGSQDTFTLTVQSGQITPPATTATPPPPPAAVPTPTVSAITRNSIPSGVSTFLRVYGTNFRDGIQLYYNGTAYPVTYENPGEVSFNSGVLSAGSYSFTLRNPGSPDSNAITVTVTPPATTATPTPSPSAPAPTADIKANSLDGLTVTTGTAITVTWSSTNVSSCSVTPYGWTGTTGRQDYPTGLAAGTYTATLNCSGSQGSASDAITVTVNAASSPPAPAAPPPPPPPAPEPPPPDDKLQYYKGAVGDAPATREILAALHGALESLRSFLSQYR